MITSFPIKHLRYESVDASHLTVTEAPFYHSQNLACHVCKQSTTIGTIYNKGHALDIHSDCLFITNGRYYYVPHLECRGVFSISPLAYEHEQDS